MILYQSKINVNMYVIDIMFFIKLFKFKKLKNFFEGLTKSGWSLIRVNMQQQLKFKSLIIQYENIVKYEVNSVLFV